VDEEEDNELENVEVGETLKLENEVLLDEVEVLVVADFTPDSPKKATPPAIRMITAIAATIRTVDKARDGYNRDTG
jgi:hypothetical protein